MISPFSLLIYLNHITVSHIKVQVDARPHKGVKLFTLSQRKLTFRSTYLIIVTGLIQWHRLYIARFIYKCKFCAQRAEGSRMSNNQYLPTHYELQQRLSSTAVDEEWKAFDTQQHRYVTVRFVRMTTLTPGEFIPRFQQEMQTIAALRHPHIVPVFDFQAASSATTISDAYVISEYTDSYSLDDYLASTVRAGTLPQAQDIVQLFTALASALDYAHQQGVTHGSLKPKNILLDKRDTATFSVGTPRVTNFGLRFLYPPLSQPLPDVYYIAPEIAQGGAGNSRSDIYALGVLLYELCTGVPPFQGDTASEVMMQHIQAIPTAPLLINPHLPPAVVTVIMRALAKDQNTRFSTASALVTTLAKAFRLLSSDSSSLSGIIGISGGISGAASTPILPSLYAPIDPANSPTYLTPMPRIASSAVGADVVPMQTVASTHTPTASYQTVPAPPPQPTQLPSATPLTATASSTPLAPKPQRKRRTTLIAVVSAVLLLVILLSSALWIFHVLPTNKPAAAGKPIVGHAFFVSSGLLNLSSNEGIADRMQVELDNVPAAPAGKRFYAWLLNDNDSLVTISPVLLGALPTNGGNITITYRGDALHSDLLASYSRFLVTEENAGTTPSNPSLDTNTWRYYAAFSQVPNPNDTTLHFSLLAHLRHLLALDPKLKSIGLSGGLDIWLFRNTEKILEYAGSARDAQQTGGADLVYRQLVRILDYLDGTQYVGTEPLRPGTGLLIDPTIAKVALLEFDVQHQSPPGYLKHIGNHLREIVQSPGITDAQRKLAIQINADIDNVQGWLTNVHADAEKLVALSNAQLLQPKAATLLNDMFTQASYAFAGQIDPNTNQLKAGVVQIHYSIQRLATFEIAPCTNSNATNPCA